MFESNKNSLETIKVYIIENITENDLILFFNSLLILKKLKSVCIETETSILINDSIVHSLQELAVNCKLIKKFILNLSNISSIDLSLRILRAFKGFNNLKILELRLYKNYRVFEELETFNITSNELIGFQNLTHFTLVSDKLLITDSFFTSIDKNLPKLQSIECYTEEYRHN